MPDLEDAEAALSEQETWGLGRVGQAVKRVTAAVRLIRARTVTHEQRLDAIEARLNRLDPPS